MPEARHGGRCWICLSSGTVFSHVAGSVALFPASCVFQKCGGHWGIQLLLVLLGYWKHLWLCAGSSKAMVLFLPLKEPVCLIARNIKNLCLFAYRRVL